MYTTELSSSSLFTVQLLSTFDSFVEETAKTSGQPTDHTFWLIWKHRMFPHCNTLVSPFPHFSDLLERNSGVCVLDLFELVSLYENSPIFLLRKDFLESVLNSRLAKFTEFIRLQQILVVLILEISENIKKISQKSNLIFPELEEKIRNFDFQHRNFKTEFQFFAENFEKDNFYNCKIKKTDCQNKSFFLSFLSEFSNHNFPLKFKKPTFSPKKIDFKYICFEDFQKNRAEYSGVIVSVSKDIDFGLPLTIFPQIDYSLDTEDEYGLLDADDCSNLESDPEEAEEEILSEDKNFLVDDDYASDTQEDQSFFRKKQVDSDFTGELKLLVTDFRKDVQMGRQFRAVDLKGKVRNLTDE